MPNERFGQIDIDKVARSLAHPSAPRCWCILIPPGLGDEKGLAEALKIALRQLSPPGPVALVSADMLVNREHYAEQLSIQWLGQKTGLALDQLLARFTSTSPAFQVLIRFHKIIRELDPWVLGELRDAEQSHRLRTATLSPLSYGELRRRWRAENVAFCVSDYGESPKHMRQDFKPMTPEGLNLMLKPDGVPQWLSDEIFAWTGGFPSPVDAVLGRWQAEGCPTNGERQIRALLRKTAAEAFEKMVEMLDSTGESNFKEALCDLYQNIDVTNARLMLGQHEWSSSITEDGRLRAKGLGAAAEAAVARSAAAGNKWAEIWRRGQLLYRGRDYESAERLLSSFLTDQLPEHVLLLKKLSAVMSLISGSEGVACTNWSGLGRLATDALHLAEILGRKSPETRVLLSNRLSELVALARDVDAAQKANKRYVDALSGIGGKMNALVAARVLCLQFYAASQVKDNDPAVRLAITLPEQIFRSWASIALNLNYYSTPTDGDGDWIVAEQEWRRLTRRDGSLKRSIAGREFPSFVSFTYFAEAMHRRTAPDAPCPHNSFDELQRDLSFLEARNDGAHAMVFVDQHTRQKYMRLAQSWLDALCKCCGASGYEELLRIADPLPLLGADGSFA